MGLIKRILKPKKTIKFGGHKLDVLEDSLEENKRAARKQTKARNKLRFDKVKSGAKTIFKGTMKVGKKAGDSFVKYTREQRKREALEQKKLKKSSKSKRKSTKKKPEKGYFEL